MTFSLCKLIIKSFPGSNFKFDCTDVKDLTNNELEKLTISPHCIVLDKEINKAIQDKIKSMFPNIDIVYLPSLNESDSEIPNGCKQISEPLKLSELGNVLEEIYNKKKDE
jgi:hypothetical protein